MFRSIIIVFSFRRLFVYLKYTILSIKSQYFPNILSNMFRFNFFMPRIPSSPQNVNSEDSNEAMFSHKTAEKHGLILNLSFTPHKIPDTYTHNTAPNPDHWPRDRSSLLPPRSPHGDRHKHRKLPHLFGTNSALPSGNLGLVLHTTPTGAFPLSFLLCCSFSIWLPNAHTPLR